MVENKFSNYSKWNHYHYLQEFYAQPIDDDPTLRFVVEQGKRLRGKRVAAIEVGSGPVVCYFAGLAVNVTKIDVADYLQENIDYIRNWLGGVDNSFDWSQYLGFILNYAGDGNVTADQIRELENLVRSRVSRFHLCDIKKDNPIGSSYYRAYDCVLSVSCADSITNDINEWREYMRNIFSLLKPGGFFIGESLKKCNYYQVGEWKYPVTYLTEEDCVNVMVENGFDKDSIVMRVEPESFEIDQSGNKTTPLRSEYSDVILTSGYLRS